MLGLRELASDGANVKDPLLAVSTKIYRVTCSTMIRSHWRDLSFRAFQNLKFVHFPLPRSRESVDHLRFLRRAPQRRCRTTSGPELHAEGVAVVFPGRLLLDLSFPTPFKEAPKEFRTRRDVPLPLESLITPVRLRSSRTIGKEPDLI